MTGLVPIQYEQFFSELCDEWVNNKVEALYEKGIGKHTLYRSPYSVSFEFPPYFEDLTVTEEIQLLSVLTDPRCQ